MPTDTPCTPRLVREGERDITAGTIFERNDPGGVDWHRRMGLLVAHQVNPGAVTTPTPRVVATDDADVVIVRYSRVVLPDGESQWGSAVPGGVICECTRPAHKATYVGEFRARLSDVTRQGCDVHTTVSVQIEGGALADDVARQIAKTLRRGGRIA